MDKFHFSDKKEDLEEAPKLRSAESEALYRKAYEKSKNKSHAKFVATATGCKKSDALSILPGHNRINESQPDPCHTIKDVINNIMNVVTGNKINLAKIVTAEKKVGRTHLLQRASDEGTLCKSTGCNEICASEVQDVEADSAVKSGKRKTKIKSCGSVAKKQKMGSEATCKKETESLPFMLTKEELKTADKQAESIRVPKGFGLRPSPFISRTGPLKSHDWIQLATQGIIKYCLRGTLDNECRKTLYFLLNCLSDMCQEKLTSFDIDELEVKLSKALALLEMNFPLHLQNITTHLLHHIPESLRRLGPVYSSWMFVFERFNSWLCKRVLNMRYPEATETFLLYDWCSYMFQYKRVSLDLQSFSLHTTVDGDGENLEGVDHTEFQYHGSVGKKTCRLKKRNGKSIHRLSCTPVCEHCFLHKYHYHKEVHPKTKRVLNYTPERKESSTACTMSSYVCIEVDRGPRLQKVSSGKFLEFGRIQYFVEHIDNADSEGGSSQELEYNTLSFIKWQGNVKFDSDSNLWYAEQRKESEQERLSFVLTSSLSLPLVTAIENECLWFLNSGKKQFFVYKDY